MKKIPVWKNVVLLVSLLAVIIVATLAWFFYGPRTGVEGMNVSVGKATYVQVSGDHGNNWSEDLEVEFGLYNKFKEISGNGLTFFAPVYDVVENEEGGFSPKIMAFNAVTDTQVYFDQYLEFRADDEQTIYLSPESTVTAVDAEGNSFIDGAIRVAFFEVDASGKENLKFIWAPNSTVEYFPDTYEFTREGNVEPYYYYQKTVTPVDVGSLEGNSEDPNVVMIPTGGETCGYNDTYMYLWSNGQELPENMPAILTLDTLGEEDLMYKQLKVRVWLEGYDRECVSQLIGDRFTMKLEFATEIGE